jgi:hypothetical protein
MKAMTSKKLMGLQEYLPPPKTSLGGLQPFNPKQGESQKENVLKRMLLALPFLGIFLFVSSALDPAVVVPWLRALISDGSISWSTGNSGKVPIVFDFYFKSLDEM